MSVFYLLWTPAFYFFWSAVTGGKASSGGAWALLGGCVTALLHFYLGPLVDPGGFGLSRWMSAFLDIVTLPALAPFIIYLILAGFRVVGGADSSADFALLWLVPGAIIRAFSWISHRDPILLVLVPVLWTAIAVGVSFFIGLIKTGRIIAIIVAVLFLPVVPLAAASSYWAFFGQKTTMGFLLLLAAVTPMLLSVILSLARADA